MDDETKRKVMKRMDDIFARLDNNLFSDLMYGRIFFTEKDKAQLKRILKSYSDKLVDNMWKELNANDYFV